MLERVFSGRDTGFYIDVGAAHPTHDSVTCHFYNKGWTGINIEPQVAYHKELEKARPKDVNLCLGLGARSGDARFYQPQEQYLATCDADSTVLEERPFEVRTITIITLAELCRTRVQKPIDFLKIDVEGWEGQVLEGGDWQTYRPMVVLIEATRPNTPEPTWHVWEPQILAHNYQFVYFDGLNRFYVRGEDADLAKHFATPPNVFDQFVSNELHQLRNNKR